MRERCGDVATDVFMSDDADAYYNAWVSTFPRPNKKLLCSWHVDRSWRRKLNEHIRDRAVLAEVYAAMKRLQNETNEAVFRRSLQQFLAWVRGLSEPLATYFEREYARRTREWASCFRLGSRVNTNMFLESFHRVLKEVYLEKKQNRRVDHLLYKLLKISRDKVYEQWIKAEKGKTTLRQRESNKRHKNAESMPREVICRVEENCWEMPSTTDKGKMHRVRKTASEMCSCLLRCPTCDACVYSFECTCLDFAIRGLVCVHIHAVNITEPDHEMKEDHITENDIEQKREGLANLIPSHKNKEICSDVLDLK